MLTPSMSMTTIAPGLELCHFNYVLTEGPNMTLKHLGLELCHFNYVLTLEDPRVVGPMV